MFTSSSARPIMEPRLLSAGTECIEKALNGTELVPEYYLELGDSMCGDWPPCHGGVGVGVSAHST